MPLFTTGTSVERSLARITNALGRAGAIEVTASYNEAELNSLKFTAHHERIRDMVFLIPVDVDSVMFKLQSLEEGKFPSHLVCYRQAQRIAWDSLRAWIVAQLDLIATGQVELAQVFLPYSLLKTGETVWGRLLNAGSVDE